MSISSLTSIPPNQRPFLVRIHHIAMSSPPGAPSRTVTTTTKADESCTAELGKGAALYGGAGLVAAFIGDALLSSTVASYRQWGSRQGKMLLGVAIVAASGWYGGYKYEEACKHGMRGTFNSKLVKMEGQPPIVRQTTTTTTSKPGH